MEKIVNKEKKWRKTGRLKNRNQTNDRHGVKTSKKHRGKKEI